MLGGGEVDSCTAGWVAAAGTILVLYTLVNDLEILIDKAAAE